MPVQVPDWAAVLKAAAGVKGRDAATGSGESVVRERGLRMPRPGWEKVPNDVPNPNVGLKMPVIPEMRLCNGDPRPEVLKPNCPIGDEKGLENGVMSPRFPKPEGRKGIRLDVESAVFIPTPGQNT